MDNKAGFVALDFVQGHRATIVEAAVWVNPYESVKATGEAIQHTEDKSDPALGALLAQARALEALSRKLLKRANGQIKCAEDNRYRLRQATDDTVAVQFTATGKPRCQEYTRAGNQCRNASTDDYIWCGKHGG